MSSTQSGAGDSLRQHSFQFEGVEVTYYRGGQGKPLLLLHGSGPGASSMGNWNPILPSLLENFEVFAVDLVGFGKSGRKPHPPYFDFAMWVRQAKAMLDLVRPGEKVGVIGHSISAAVALSIASRNARIAAVLTTGAMGQRFAPVEQTESVWTGPRDRKQLVTTLSGIIFDANVITEAYLQAREPVVFAPGYADYFDQMFEGDKQHFVDAAILSDELLASIQQPVVLLHGKQDIAFPASTSIELAQKLPHAELMLLDRCSHSVAFERSSTLLAIANDHFSRHLN
ncbi:alpha/beta fold hydrolase [Comamonas testosteroni]|uniref:alpha/beta fold hydrolase n=1 Tax=Comamonas testosteroni TaxID=285 RepID=UPI003899D887